MHTLISAMYFHLRHILLIARRFSETSPLQTVEVDALSESTNQSAIGEAVELALYSFDAFKLKKKEETSKPKVTLLRSSQKEDEEFRKGRIIGKKRWILTRGKV